MSDSFVKIKPLYLAIVFITVLLGSLLVHIPAGFVAQTSAVKAQLDNAGVTVSSTTGTLWNGSANLRYKQQSLGELKWNLQAMSLLMLKADLNFNWQLKNSELKGDINTGLLNLENLDLVNIEGVVQLDQAMQIAQNINPKIPSLLSGLAGKLEIENLDTSIDLHNRWPKKLQAETKLTGLNFMGNQFPSTKLSLQQAEAELSPIDTSILGEGKGWNLTGQLQLNPKLNYSGDIEVKAATENSLPDWAFLMPRKSPTHYSMQVNGRF
jgi:hypothetical protein